MNDAPKLEGALSQEELPKESEAARKSEIETSSSQEGTKTDKVVFNGREYASLEDAEKSYKELQTTYQRVKAEKEQLEADKIKDPQENDFLKVLFGDSEPAPAPKTPPTTAPAPMLNRDQIRVSLLVAEKDPSKPMFKDVANEVAKLLVSDPIISATASIGYADKAVTLAYAQAVANRIDSLKSAEYTRGREEALRESAKPKLAGSDNKEAPPAPKKDLKDMTLEEMRAVLPIADPR